MDLRSTDDFDVLDVVFLLFTLALAGLHLYLGAIASTIASDRATQFLVIGLILLAGPVVYITLYWRPVLYLLGATLAMILGVNWMLNGMEFFDIGLLAGVLATGVIILGIYLFVRAEST